MDGWIDRDTEYIDRSRRKQVMGQKQVQNLDRKIPLALKAQE